MTIQMLYSKIHRATITDANLNYEGSVSIDEKLIKAGKFFIGQKVDIVNINNGERFSTYIIKGKSGEICLNGAAARKAQIGDLVIILAYCNIEIKKANSHKSIVVHVNNKNKQIKDKNV